MNKYSWFVKQFLFTLVVVVFFVIVLSLVFHRNLVANLLWSYYFVYIYFAIKMRNSVLREIHNKEKLKEQELDQLAEDQKQEHQQLAVEEKSKISIMIDFLDKYNDTSLGKIFKSRITGQVSLLFKLHSETKDYEKDYESTFSKSFKVYRTLFEEMYEAVLTNSVDMVKYVEKSTLSEKFKEDSIKRIEQKLEANDKILDDYLDILLIIHNNIESQKDTDFFTLETDTKAMKEWLSQKEMFSIRNFSEEG